jgi:hypothetical protein
MSSAEIAKKSPQAEFPSPTTAKSASLLQVTAPPDLGADYQAGGGLRDSAMGWK